VLLPLLLGLPGCDIALGVYFATKKKSSTSQSLPPSTPSVSYTLYVANFASPAAAAAEKTNLDSDANGGNPNPATWTLLGQGSATSVWPISGNMNAILVQGPLTQVYNIDTFERLDANGAVVEVPTSANIYFNRNVTNPTNASGMLDGVPATTVTTDPAHIPCIFALFTQSITSARIRIWGANQTSGDCVWSNHHELAGTDNFMAGGSTVNSTGVVYTTYVDTTAGQSWLLPFQANGTKNSPISVLTANASSSSSISAAVDAGDNIFVTASVTGGGVQIQKFANGATSATWGTTFASGINQIAANSLAVASNAPLHLGGTGSVIIFAGQVGTGNHSIVRYDDLLTSGSFIYATTTPADPSKATGWSGASISGGTNVLTTGDLNNSTSGNIELFTEASTLTGTLLWPNPPTTTGGGASTNNGNAIGTDGQGFAYVAGNFGSNTHGKDSVIIQYKASDGSGLNTLYKNSTFAEANEFLGIAVDTDGTIYAVGYINQSNLVSTTAAPPVTSWWIGKFAPTGLVPVWTATFNFGLGNDQAMSVAISGNYVYVVGSEIYTGPKTGLRVLKFMK
jgi:hypothetical protein